MRAKEFKKEKTTKKLDKNLAALRNRRMGAMMHNFTEVEQQPNVDVPYIDYICPECFELNRYHWAEDPCPDCGAPSHLVF